MSLQREKFLKFYEYEYVKGSDFLVICKATNKKLYIPFGAKVNLTYDQTFESIEEAKELIKLGKIDSVTGEDLYREILNFDDEMICNIRYGYSLKTKHYIDKIKQELNFKKYVFDEIDLNEDEDEEYKYLIGTISGIDVASPLRKIRIDKKIDIEKLYFDLYKIDNNYIVQSDKRIKQDNYFYMKYYFDKRPTFADFELVEFILSLDTFLQENCKWKEKGEFINGVHWTELEGTFKEKALIIINNLAK